MEEDLPLLSNVCDILVRHYQFKFECNFPKKCFDCSVILFLESVSNPDVQICNCLKDNDYKTEPPSEFFSTSESSILRSNKPSLSNYNEFQLILDCHKIKVNYVSEICLRAAEIENFKFYDSNPGLVSATKKLYFLVNDWSLKIKTGRPSCKFCFPKFIKISYQTLASSPSLLWVTDQDGKPSVFTHGAAVNNRSLFPCQEPPTAMATWEAIVTVSNSAVVLMSGDSEPLISYKNGVTEYYYFTKKILPLSTLCLAIGFWKEHLITQKYKCRIFSPSSLIDLAILDLFEYVPYSLMILEDMFGDYPFPRIDFLIVPPTFGSLGMASPNLVFLSQSLLAGDGSMSSRISHEIAHGWFGLLIGALDWTEEWLSEGFATFVEDYVHTRVMNMSSSERRDYMELRSCIRRNILLAEIENTENDLQIMRSSKGKIDTDIVDGMEATVLKNGQNPMKGFMQVHYIKGYFLLKYLADAVGIEKFILFLRAYIEKYAGCLFTSEDFLSMYFSYFPFLKETFTLDDVYKTWLHNPGIPEPISNSSVSKENKLLSEVKSETEKWIGLNKTLLRKRATRKEICCDQFSIITSEQIILLLENLLQVNKASGQMLKTFNRFFKFKELNAEVLHRWFELVVKHKYKDDYPALKNFITNHLALGVYLYGEMIFSNDVTLKQIARDCYEALESEMELNYKKTIAQMLVDATDGVYTRVKK